MAEISKLIYETCKTYLITQGKFLILLEVFVGAIIIAYFGPLRGFDPMRVLIILAFSIIGIFGSYSVAWFGILINTYANSRTAFAASKASPTRYYRIPLSAGMSIGLVLIATSWC
jgi:K(+)-stimulated pyrophosphate-energized sodium pump